MTQDSMTTKCKYPIGIQTFSRIISEGYIYVDTRTPTAWMADTMVPVCL